MPPKPLLIFPTPTDVTRYKLFSGPGKPLVKPERSEQITRLEPQFQLLDTMFTARRAQVQQTAAGVDPELVLVFETRGPVDNFLNAVKQFPELEWLGDLEEEFQPDELFFFRDDQTREIKGKVFLVMSNLRGLQQLKSLWDNYYITGRTFPRGTTKWRDLFDLLHDVRYWSVIDRIAETGILRDWQDRLTQNQEEIFFEIELWYRGSEAKRNAAKERILGLVEQFDGELLKECLLHEISYHSLLIKGPIGIFENLQEETGIDLFKASDIMFVRPVGQCAVRTEPNAEEQLQQTPSESAALSPPILAVLDGMPLQNHFLLQDRIYLDDPDDFQASYTLEQRKHGTAMCSLAIYGDLNGNETPIKSKIYVRPVMKAFQDFSGSFERVPETELVLDIIHRSVKRIFDDPTLSATIKIINLSIGDPFRIYDNTISSLARLIDWLSFKYNVLFIVSAGNCGDNLVLTGLQSLLGDANRLASESIRFIYENVRNRKIISPAESMNALTVGASHCDSATDIQLNRRVDIFDSSKLISPISRVGFGHRRSIKPDVLMPGGRVLFSDPLSASELRVNSSLLAPGQKVAYPLTGGGITGTAYVKGTSNAAMILSRTAVKLFENFESTEQTSPEILGEFFPVVAKSLLVHGASWDEQVADRIRSAIPGFQGNERDLVCRFLGYGCIDVNRIMECTDQRVSLLGYGELSAEEAHLFKLPLPISISGQVMWKRLTVTLAWLTPVNTLNQVYRQAKLWFDFPNRYLEQRLSVARKLYDNSTVMRGTVQHEIFEGERASVFTANDFLDLRVNCKTDASSFQGPIKYALCATLEVQATAPLDIYSEVRARIQPAVRV